MSPQPKQSAPAKKSGGGKEAVGAILGKEEVRKRIENGELLKNTDEAQLEPARYYLRLAQAELVVPVHKSVAKSGFRRYTEKRPLPDGHDLLLQPGDAALVSTIEHFVMPGDVSGSLGLPFRQARRGLLPLAGPIADPGFGWPNGEPLYMLIANMNSQPVALRPGDAIASVQFVKIAGASTVEPKGVKRQIIEEWFDDAEQHGPQLAFFGQLNDTRQQVDELTKSVTKIEDSIDRYSVMGVFLIGAALILAFVTALAGLLKDLDVVGLNRDLPDAFWFAALVVAAILVWALFRLPYKAFDLIKPRPTRRSLRRFQPWRWNRPIRDVLVLIRADEWASPEDVSMAAFGSERRHERVTEVACNEPKFRDRIKKDDSTYEIRYDTLVDRMRAPSPVSRLPRTAATPPAPP
jgi:deoxycytidine triphosphate deaminase